MRPSQTEIVCWLVMVDKKSTRWGYCYSCGKSFDFYLTKTLKAGTDGLILKDITHHSWQTLVCAP